MIERTTRPLARRVLIVDDELGQATTGGRLVVLPEIAGVHTPFAAAARHGD